MTKELRSLLQKLENAKQEVRSLLNEDKTQDAKAKMNEVRELQEKVDLLRGTEDLEQRNFEGKELNGTHREELKPGEVRALSLEQRMKDFAEPFVYEGEERQLSIGKYVRGLVTGNWEGAAAERRAMSEGVLSDGGYLVPTELSSSVIDLARNKARVMQAGARTIPMSSNNITFAKVLTAPTANWKKENDPIPESGMTFGAVTLNAKTLTSMSRMSVELLEDAINLDNIVADAIAQGLALELDRVGLFGKGIDPEPLGLYGTTGIQKIDMGANGGELKNYDPFSLAVEQIENVNGTANALLWSPRTAGTVDRFKDGMMQPLAAPESFRNLTKLPTNQIPNDMTKGTANNASCVVVGAWNNMFVGMRRNIVLEVSRTAAGAFEKLQVVIRAYLRADIVVAKPEQFVIIDGIIPPIATP